MMYRLILISVINICWINKIGKYRIEEIRIKIRVYIKLNIWNDYRNEYIKSFKMVKNQLT